MVPTNPGLLDAQPVELTESERAELDAIFETTQDIDLSHLSHVPPKPAPARRVGVIDLLVGYVLNAAYDVINAVCWAFNGIGRGIRSARAYVARYAGPRGKHRVTRSVIHMGRDLSTAEKVRRAQVAREASDQEGDLPGDDFVSWLTVYIRRQRDIDEILHPLAHGSPRHLTC